MTCTEQLDQNSGHHVKPPRFDAKAVHLSHDFRLAQKDPTIEPIAITTTSAITAPTIPTMTMSR